MLLVGLKYVMLPIYYFNKFIATLYIIWPFFSFIDLLVHEKRGILSLFTRFYGKHLVSDLDEIGRSRVSGKS